MKAPAATSDRDVQILAGHAALSITQRYGMIQPPELEAGYAQAHRTIEPAGAVGKGSGTTIIFLLG
jgi:hypothetical protein